MSDLTAVQLAALHSLAGSLELNAQRTRREDDANDAVAIRAAITQIGLLETENARLLKSLGALIHCESLQEVLNVRARALGEMVLL